MITSHQVDKPSTSWVSDPSFPPWRSFFGSTKILGMSSLQSMLELWVIRLCWLPWRYSSSGSTGPSRSGSIASALGIKAGDLGEVKKLDLSILTVPLPGAMLACGMLVLLTHRILWEAKSKETNFLSKTIPLRPLHTLLSSIKPFLRVFLGPSPFTFTVSNLDELRREISYRGPQFSTCSESPGWEYTAPLKNEKERTEKSSSVWEWSSMIVWI